MDANTRREEIVKLLLNADGPLKGQELALKFNVTRQVIVKDLSILKSRMENIISTSEGYMILRPDNRKKSRIIVTHRDNEIMDELKAIIKYGGYIEDIIIEHPFYGELKANLYLKSLNDLEKFVENFKALNARPLSELTEGLHMHTISYEREEDLQNIKKELDEKGYLIKED